MNTSKKTGKVDCMKVIMMSFAFMLIGGVSFAQTLGSLYPLNQQENNMLFVEDGMELTEALALLENHFNVVFLYRSETVDGAVVNSNRMLPADLDAALERLLNGKGLTFKNLNPKTYGIYEKGGDTADISESAYALQHTVSGTIVDAQNREALPGVNIVVDGTTTGTTTNLDGEFQLTVSGPEVTLVISYIGYQSQTINLDGRTELNIELSMDVFTADELVVVGYGTQRSGEVTSSIATVRSGDFNQGASSSSPMQLVQGKVAGLAIHRAAGGDPTQDVHILLRGVSSVRGDNSPLVVIDGVPGGQLNTVSPQDIESIDVLRDGSAAAIYGTRGNAGVIIITTKKGQADNHSISYSGRSYTENWHNKPRVLNANEYRNLRTEFQNSGNPLLESRASSIVDFGHETDWFDAITEDFPISHEHFLSISGGSANTTYYGSINYRDLQGFIRESSNNILNGRLNITHSGLDDRMSVDVNISNTLRRGNPVNYQAYRQALGRNPTMPIYNEDGSFHEVDGWQMYNPVALLKQFQHDDENRELLANTGIRFSFTDGLDFSVRGAIQTRNQIEGEYESRNSWDSIQGGYSGQATRSAAQWTDRTFESYLNYTETFGTGHNFRGMAGYSFQDFEHESFRARNRNFLTDDLGYNNLGAGLHLSEGIYQNDVGSYKRSNKLVAFFGRVNYNFNNTYMVSASLRHEGSSRFGDGNKWGNFPAVSFGWAVSNESFMQDFTAIDELRLRVGYGVTGNQGFDDYISLERLQRAGVMFYEGNWIPGYAPGSNPNPNLRWERKAEINFGIDLAMLNNRLKFNVDVYDRSTQDLIYEYPVPVPPNLYPTLWTNVGDLKNRGIEFTVSSSPIVTPRFFWRTDFNISYNTNELVSLSDDVFSHSPLDHTALGAPGMSGHTVYRLEEGEPIGNIVGWRHAGFTDDGRWLFYTKDRSDIVTADQITFDDRVIIGNGLPKSIMGFTNSFNYRNLDLSLGLRGSFGFHLVNTRRNYYENVIMMPTNILKSSLDVPMVDDPQFSDFYVERGDYLKIDNLTIGYTIPVTGIRYLRVYASGQNLYTFTGYSGQDPEIGIEGLSPGFDVRWIYPSVRTFSVGIDIQF